MQDLSGRKLGQYELRERLGRGGMAEVYKAYQSGMDRFVAVKLMLPHLTEDEEFITRFRREAQAVGKLRHPHIVQIFDFGDENGVYYMAMEYIEGGTLKDVIKQKGKLSTLEAVTVASQIADALTYAHTAGMIHRDLKPANIMFTDTEQKNAILTDFGIARILAQSNLTMSGMTVGTPAYMSPEAGRGERADERADIYALGIILYEMLTGQAPYDADTPLAVIMKHINAPLPTRKDYGNEVPETVEKVIFRSMAKNQEDRYQTAAEMKAALDNAINQLSERPTEQHQSPVVDSTQKAPALLPDEQTMRLTSDSATQAASATKPMTAPPATAPNQATIGNQASSSRMPMFVGIGIVALVLIGIVFVLTQNPNRDTLPIPTLPNEAVGSTATALEVVQVEASATSLATDSPSAVPSEVSTIEVMANPSEVSTVEVMANLSEISAEPNASVSEVSTAEATESLAANATEQRFTDGEAPPHANNLKLFSGLSETIDSYEQRILTEDSDTLIAELDGLLAESPDDIELLFIRNQAQSVDYWDPDLLARADAQRIRELDPDSPLGYIAMFTSLVSYPEQDTEAALNLITEAYGRFPENPQIMWRYANASAWEDEYELAEAAEVAGASGYNYMDYMGDFWYSREEFARAVPYLAALLDSDTWFSTTDSDVRLRLVNSLLHLESYDEALALIQEIASEFDDANEYTAAAAIAYLGDNHDLAEDWAETAIALEDTAYEAQWIDALLDWYDDGDLEQALEILTRLETIEEFYPRYMTLEFDHHLTLDKAHILMDAGRVADAIVEYDKLISEYDYTAWIYEERADAYLELGNLTAARDDLRYAYEIESDRDYKNALLSRVREVTELLENSPTAEATAEVTAEATEVP